MKATTRSELLKLLRKTQAEGLSTRQQAELANQAGLRDPRAKNGWTPASLSSFKNYWGVNKKTRRMAKMIREKMPEVRRKSNGGDDHLVLIELIAQQKTMPREQRLKAIQILSGASV